MLFLLRMLAPICIAVAAAFIMSIYTFRYLNAAGLLLCVCVFVFLGLCGIKTLGKTLAYTLAKLMLMNYRM